MCVRPLCLIILAFLTLTLSGCKKAETAYVSSDEWRGVLTPVLHNNPPGSAHFAETTWLWSSRLFQQAAASKRDGLHRAQDRKALMEWAVLAHYLKAYDATHDSPSAFGQNDQELMSTAMKHAVETFGQPAMGKSWNSFSALWKEYGLAPVERPFN